MQAFAKGIGPFVEAVTEHDFLHATKLTLMLAAISVPLNTVSERQHHSHHSQRVSWKGANPAALAAAVHLCAVEAALAGALATS